MSLASRIGSVVSGKRVLDNSKNPSSAYNKLQSAAKNTSKPRYSRRPVNITPAQPPKGRKAYPDIPGEMP